MRDSGKPSSPAAKGKLRLVSSNGVRPPHGGEQGVAEMLARLDAPTRERLLAGVEEARPGLSTSLRRKMLRFEDLGELGVSELQRFFSQFPPQRWALALRGAEESLVKKLLAVLPARASQGILEERELMGPRPLRDVQLARQEICEKAQSLGLLPLPSGSDRSGGSGKSDQGSQGG